jgi:putative phosphoesterase
MAVIGVISDTHGLLREEALAALSGSEHIVHAGDVGKPEILDQLREIAPVTAVRGNVDHGAWSRELPDMDTVEVDGILIYVLHILAELDFKPEAAGFGVVIYGHSHVPKQAVKHGVLYFNPGSAGPRRFRLPVSVGKLVLGGGHVHGEIVNLECEG